MCPSRMEPVKCGPGQIVPGSTCCSGILELGYGVVGGMPGSVSWCPPRMEPVQCPVSWTHGGTCCNGTLEIVGK